MLTRSFIFAKGMTEELERALWARGVVSWDLLRRHSGEASAAIGEARTRKLIQAVVEAQGALAARDTAWFTRNWPERDFWRLWQGYCEPAEVACVDIETTGRTPGYDQITVIGLATGTQTRAFVAERPADVDLPLTDFPEAMKKCRLLVTFNGVGFDVPFIERHFRTLGFTMAMPHIDLIFPARALGLSGGLKDMEKTLGIVRNQDIADVRGLEAIALWGRWRQGDRSAYDRLVTYCQADCANLIAFAEIIYRRKWTEVYTSFAREIDLDEAMGQQLTLF